MKNLIQGFFLIAVLAAPIVSNAEDSTSEPMLLPIGASHQFVKDKYGAPDVKLLRGTVVTWVYTNPDISVMFDKKGLVIGWIQKH